MSRPRVPHEPMIKGTRSASRAFRRRRRSRLHASLDNLGLPEPKYAGPESVDPASHAMKVGSSSTPLRRDSTLNPAPKTPVAAKTLTSMELSATWSLGGFFERQPAGLRPEYTDGNHDHQHAQRDKGKDAGRAEIAKHDRYGESGKHRRQSAEGVDKTHRAGANAGWIQRSLIRVV